METFPNIVFQPHVMVLAYSSQKLCKKHQTPAEVKAIYDLMTRGRGRCSGRNENVGLERVWTGLGLKYGNFFFQFKVKLFEQYFHK